MDLIINYRNAVINTEHAWRELSNAILIGSSLEAELARRTFEGYVLEEADAVRALTKAMRV